MMSDIPAHPPGHRAPPSLPVGVVAACLTLSACQPAERPAPPAPLAEPVPPATSTPPADPPPPLAADLGAPASTTSSEPPTPDPTTGAPTEPAGPCPAGMALVEGGSVSRKQHQRWKKLYPEAEPPPAEMPPFCLDLLEATQADLAACAEVIQARPNMLSCVARGDCGTKPVENLGWREAARYCAFRGKRLPTLVEWLWAAGGGAEDRKFPWGDAAPTVKHLNGCDEICARGAMSDCDDADKKSGFCTLQKFSNVRGEDGHDLAAPVGSFPDGAGRWGHLDLAGNVYEHVLTRPDSGDFICGGSYAHTFPGFSFSLHKAICETAGGRPVGVRCASEPAPTGQPR